MKLFVVLALVAAVPLAAFAQKKPGEAASLDKVEIQGDVKPGATFTAVIHVKLDKGFHAHSNKPSEPNFIPTALKLEPKRRVKAGAVKYPEGKSEKVTGLDKPLSVYENGFQVAVPLTLDAEAKLPLAIPATLSYQACQGATCYPPKKLKFDILLISEVTKQ
jgi:hypothetical protein